MFFGEVFEQLDVKLEHRPVLEMRIGWAFFQAAVFDVPDAEGVEHAIKVPFWRWLGLKERITRRRRCWERVDETVDLFDQWLWAAGLVTRDACRGVPQACASPDGKELTT